MIVSLLKEYENIQNDVNIFINGQNRNISTFEIDKLKYLLLYKYKKFEISIELQKCNSSYIIEIWKILNNDENKRLVVETENEKEFDTLLEYMKILDKLPIMVIKSNKEYDKLLKLLEEMNKGSIIETNIEIFNENMQSIIKNSKIEGIIITLDNLFSLDHDTINRLKLINRPVRLNIQWENIKGRHSRHLINLEEYEKITKTLLEWGKIAKNEESEIKRFLRAYYIVGKNIMYAFNEDGESDRSYKSHSLIGAIMDRKATCEGYAETLSQLLNLLKIKNKCVTGVNKFDKKDKRHIWNQVQINGVWYNCDITNDSVNIQERRKPELCLLSDKDYALYIATSKNAEKCKSTYWTAMLTDKSEALIEL